MGIASLVIGIVAIIIALIPICGAIAFLPALAGLALGIIDLINKKNASASEGMSIAGIALNVGAIIFIVFWVFISAIGSTL